MWLVVLFCVSHTAVATFIAVGFDGASGQISRSVDGVSWNSSTTSPLTTFARGIAYSPSLRMWIAVGTGASFNIASSADGETWLGVGSGVFGGTVYGVTWGQGMFVIMGSGMVNTMASFDGTTFSGQGNSIFNVAGIAAAFSSVQNRWVAVGGDTNQIATSLGPALNWTVVGGGMFGVGRAIAFGAGVWVAGGNMSANTLATSPDGITWTGLGSTIFSSSCFGLAYANGRFVATGAGALNTLAFSLDGVTWNGLGKSVFSGQGNGAVFGDNMWIVVGGGTNSEALSADGATFSGAQPLFGIGGSGLNVATDASTGTVTTTPGQTQNACGSLPSCTCSGSVCTSTVSVVSNATLSVSTLSTLNVVGSVTLAPSSTLVVSITSEPQVALLTATSSITVNGVLHLSVGSVGSGTVTIASAPVIDGTFSSVQVASLDACTNVTSSSPMYTSSTISVAFQTSNTCSGLSGGAIAGIVVGSVFGLAIVAAVLGVAVRNQRMKSEMNRLRGPAGKTR
jgi:hypothetical protein